MPLLIAVVSATTLLIGSVAAIGSSTHSPTVMPTPVITPASASASLEPTQSLYPTNTPTSEPTATPIPTAKPLPTSRSTIIPTSATIRVLPTSAPAVQQQSQSNYQCNCSISCKMISSCDEAYYQLNICGCSVRDGDHDGVPCEEICPGG